MDEFYKAIIQQGIAGLILALIVLPLLKWLIDLANKQRSDFKEFLSNHSHHEIEALAELKSTLKTLMDYFIDRKHSG